MIINKENIKRLVGIFYRPTYKTFYINSVDGQKILREPIGVFVSLGITTSLDTITKIKDILNNNREYSAKIVEICSIKDGEDFINFVSEENNPSQYKVSDIPRDAMNREESMKKLEELKNNLNPSCGINELLSNGPKAQKLQSLIDKIDQENSWDSHLIQEDKETGEFKIYHLFLNYEKREDGKEYRIGILVNEKQGINH